MIFTVRQEENLLLQVFAAFNDTSDAFSNTKFMNFYPFNDIETISPRPLLFITGDQAHSKEFSEDAYKRAAEPKELYYVAGAGHVDLYDRVELIRLISSKASSRLI